MNKNYINIIRKSLNDSREERPKNNNKIVFPKCDYKSESVFIDEERIQKMKSKQKTKTNIMKTKKRKRNPKVGNISISDDDQYYQTVDNVSDSSIDNFLTPSKSEIVLKRQEIGIYSESENSNDDESEFELDEFSNSRDLINNESLIESYSEIEDEFNSVYIKNVKISTNKLYEEVNEIECEQEEEVSKEVENPFPCATYENSEDVDNQNNINVISEETQEGIYNQSHYEPNEVNSNEQIDDIEEYETLSGDIENNEIQNRCANDHSPPDISAKYFDYETFIVVILKEQRSIPFYGNFVIKVLRGKVQILGSILDKSSTMTEIYSPRGYSLLVLKNITDGEEEINLKDIYQFSNFKEKILNTVVNKNSAVLLCFKMQNERLMFIQKYISQQLFPKIQNENLPQVIFEPKDNMNLVLENKDWEDIVNIVNSSTKMFIAGGKGVGKSTFLRYMINKLLNKFDEIRVIDLDPGQSEFFVPGCLSVVKISEPCIGPNFTHIRKPERSYLCDISIGDPVFYIKIVKSLMDYASTLEKLPTLINYMGYSKGLGIKITSSVITLVKPTNIIQIESQHKNKNFPCDLTLANIRKNCDYFGGKPTGLSYRVNKLTSSAEETTGWKLEPRQARELCILAYLGEVMTESISSLTDPNLPMYEIKLSSVKVRDLRNKELPPAAINANLVALCNLDETYESFICLGFGIVRGIDLENDYLVLITQINPEILDLISYLVLSSITLPPSVYMTPQNIRGLMPYVMEGELTSLAQLTKRSYLPAGHTSSK